MTAKERRYADTLEMIHAINRNAERAAYKRTCERYEDWLLDQEARKRNSKKMGRIFAFLGIATLLAAYAAMWWHSEQLLALYGG